MKNDLMKIQNILMKEMERLDDDEYMRENAKEEIARSNALSSSSESYIKAVLTNIRIMEIASKNSESIDFVQEKLGLTYNEK